MPTTIYCDEAGFTGNNLLDSQQPYFAYASVAMEPEEAASIVERVVRDHRIDAGELKGQRLLRSNRGRKAVADVHRACGQRSIISIWHKRYTLASKFFEHIFEPVLAEQNSIFYRVGFHKFISNILYFESITNSERALKALEAFQRFMIAPGEQHPDTIFPVTVDSEYSSVIREIETFTVCHRDAIAADAKAHGSENSLYRWMLEVSMSALWGLLGTWSTRAPEGGLRVYCDESKPLIENRAHFDIMIGRTDRHYSFFDPTVPITFNLDGPLQFVSSHTHPGIQLADVMASACAHAFKNSIDRREKAWEWLTIPTMAFPVLPDEDVFDLNTREAFVNTIVLHELVERSLKGHDLFEDMPLIMARAGRLHVAFLESQGVFPELG
jgi:hypothetical protein